MLKQNKQNYLQSLLKNSLTYIFIISLFLGLSIFIIIYKNRSNKETLPIKKNNISTVSKKASQQNNKVNKYSFTSIKRGYFIFTYPFELDLIEPKSEMAWERIQIKPKNNPDDFEIWIDNPPHGLPLELKGVWETIPIIINSKEYKKGNIYKDNTLIGSSFIPKWTEKLGSINIFFKEEKEKEALHYTTRILETIEEIEKTEALSSTPQKPEQLILEPEQLENYYKIYEDPFVIHLRKSLNGYLDGSNYGIESPKVVIESRKEENYLHGLSSFSKDYYKSKFIVFTINDSIVGGKEITIIFQDKPDKLFWAWVYKLASNTDKDAFDLRAFAQDLRYSEEKMQEIQIIYKVFLEDREHAL